MLATYFSINFAISVEIRRIFRYNMSSMIKA